MTLLSTIKKERMCLLQSSTKEAALQELIDCICRTGLPCGPEELRREIFHREKLMSTGIGLGIGLPHVRLESVTDLVIAIGVRPGGIGDYESIDNQPVNIVVMIVAGKDQHQQYLTLLASLVKLLKRKPVLDALLAVKTPEELYDRLYKEADHV